MFVKISASALSVWTVFLLSGCAGEQLVRLPQPSEALQAARLPAEPVINMLIISGGGDWGADPDSWSTSIPGMTVAGK